MIAEVGGRMLGSDPVVGVALISAVLFALSQLIIHGSLP